MVKASPSVVTCKSSIYGQLNFTDEDGPEICEPASDRCNDDSQRCGSRTICTAACNCWDGTMNRTTDTPRFTDSSIEGQGILSDGVCCVCGRCGIIDSFPGRLGMRLYRW